MVRYIVADNHAADLRTLNFNALYFANQFAVNSRSYTLSVLDFDANFTGYDFQYDSFLQPTAGVVRSMALFSSGTAQFLIDGMAVSAPAFTAVAQTAGTNDDLALISQIFGGNDRIQGANKADVLQGYASNDTIYGAAGDDTIHGGLGEDRIVGGAGRDTLYGGGQNDRFIFEKWADHAPGKADIIMDFDRYGNDVIDLVNLYSDFIGWRGTRAFTDVGQVRVVDLRGPDVLVQVNLDKDRAAEYEIVLKNTTISSVTQSDFLL